MDFLVSLFVGKPLNILAIAAIFVIGFLVWQFTPVGSGRLARPLLIAAVAWGLYALWEWLVQVRTPEANIRVDLMLIWPVLVILSVSCIYRSFR